MAEIKRVSVVVPNYNYGRYIKKRIRSILRQTYPIYELIVLDDCSTDGSEEIIKNIVLDLKLKNPELKLKFVPNKKNSGKAIAQWKKGFELAEGDYVWIAEADDLCSRKFLEEAMKGFDDPKVVLSYTESAIINEIGFMMAPNFRWSRDKEKTGHYKKSYIKDGKREIEEIMAIRCTIPNVSAVVFKKDERYLNYLEEALKFSQVGDWYFYVKVLEGGKIAYNENSLNRFRLHNSSKTSESRKSRLHYDEVGGMHKWFLRDFGISNQVEERMRRERSRIVKKHKVAEE